MGRRLIIICRIVGLVMMGFQVCFVLSNDKDDVITKLKMTMTAKFLFLIN